MSVLIIPCAGRSSRYPDMKPKWLLTHPTGHLMIEKAISGLDLDSFNKVVITILKEFVDKYDAEVVLRQVFPDSNFIEILVLDEPTSCVAETIALTLEKCNIQEPFVIKDCDNYIDYRVPKDITNYVVGLNVNSFPDITKLTAKSFVEIDENHCITNIIEKQIISPNICVGAYGIESPAKFLETYKLLASSYPVEIIELYISHVISYQIAMNQSSYKFVEAVGYHDWGTLDDWRQVLKNYSTYFIDIDGVVFKNYGKYGSKTSMNTCEPLKDNIIQIKELQKNGAQLIFTTSRKDNIREETIEQLTRVGLTNYTLIMNCNHAPRILINDFASTNPYPSCKAISIPRNQNLKDYL